MWLKTKLQSEAPEDITNVYISEIVIELDAEADLVNDIAEGEECTLEGEMSALRQQILNLQQRANQYLTKEHEKSTSINALRALSKAFRNHDIANRSPPIDNIVTETVDSMQEAEGEELFLRLFTHLVIIYYDLKMYIDSMMKDFRIICMVNQDT